MNNYTLADLNSRYVWYRTEQGLTAILREGQQLLEPRFVHNVMQQIAPHVFHVFWDRLNEDVVQAHMNPSEVTKLAEAGLQISTERFVRPQIPKIREL